VGRDEGATALVVGPTLLSAVHTADGEPVRLVDVRDRVVVLTLVDLDDQGEVGPVGVHRQVRAAS